MRWAVIGLALTLACATHAVGQEIGVPTGTFHNCGLTGSAKPQSVKDLNVLKNRAVVPTHLDPAITLDALQADGDDTDLFSTDAGATIRGYVSDVKVGGIETVNCRATDPQWRDTHIELVLNSGDQSLPVIVEVTPRWRTAVAGAGDDWSTAALKKALKGHVVEFTGWLLFDAEHVQNAVNTNPQGSNLWRKTVWELHPVTSMHVIQ